MKHTPGPWRVEGPKVFVSHDQKEDRAIRGEDGRHICETFQYQNHDNPNGPSVANAHLIAAAPEMYQEILQTMEDLCFVLGMVRDGVNFTDMETEVIRIVDRQDELIRKAKGE